MVRLDRMLLMLLVMLLLLMQLLTPPCRACFALCAAASTHLWLRCRYVHTVLCREFLEYSLLFAPYALVAALQLGIITAFMPEPALSVRSLIPAVQH